MARVLFDTNYLIAHWKRFPASLERTEETMRHWARKLIEQHAAEYVCTPVLIEMYAGISNTRDLVLHIAYLGEFKVIDNQNIPASVWDNALRLSKRVNPNRPTKKRHFGDCLIRAIADHFNCGVLTSDQEMRRLR